MRKSDWEVSLVKVLLLADFDNTLSDSLFEDIKTCHQLTGIKHQTSGVSESYGEEVVSYLV